MAATWPMDHRRRTVDTGRDTVRLTPLELDILRCLMANTDRVVSARELLRDVWGYADGRIAAVAVHIHALRKKVEPDPARPVFVLTVRGSGYRFCAGS